ncbi:hypothetical protein M5D96_006921 [Drosophila gunungcola]|uniref:Uncharacterized protein n=1 Tax=Drosophila gunungcola TaxID=103775 RepID=A0A9P9YN54_9MUSC|nr:hypothetical protein M5D96_006921 [Drosophila gunungcola]
MLFLRRASGRKVLQCIVLLFVQSRCQDAGQRGQIEIVDKLLRR